MEGGGVGPSQMANKNEEDNEIVVGLGVDHLPPGFRFHPTDEELIVNYLLMKVMDERFTAIAVVEADFNKCEPWDLPKKANMGEKEWFFFCQRDRKYPTGMRTNRATETGYWKATGKDREIYMKGSKNCVVGMKKTLVFYKGRAPKGVKSNWVMHEYRLEGDFSAYNFTRSAKEAWVVCKVFHKTTVMTRIPGLELARMDSFMDHLLDTPTLPPLTDCSYPNDSNSAINKPESKGNIYLNNYGSVQIDQNMPPCDNYTHNTSYQLHPRNTDPNLIFFPQNAPDPSGFFPYQGFDYHYQSGIDPELSYGTNFPFKGVEQVNLRLMAPNLVREHERTCKTENFSSNSMVSHSYETGVSTEMANEITSVNPKREDIDENKNPVNQDLEGHAFSPNMSDLDSLWSY